MPMPGMPGMPMPPQMPGAALPPNPYMHGQPPKEPIQTAGEDAITKLLQMASSNPQLLLGLSMAGAAREISQLTGLSRRRGGGTAGQKGGAMPSAATMLGGNMGDLDRLVALQSMMGGGATAPMAGPPGPGGAMPPAGGPMPMPGMPGAGLPPMYAGLV